MKVEILISLVLWSNSLLQIINGQDDQGVYKVGTGIGDITGPPAGVVLNGYVNPLGYGSGIYTRQFARTFIIESLTTKDAVVYVTCDLGMMDHSIKTEVIKRLKALHGDKFTEKNVMMSATHTHSGPSGFMTYFAYLVIESYQFNPISFWSIVDGVVESIDKAAASMTQGRVYLNKGEILGASRNRQETAYNANPEWERRAYKYDTDKDMTLLKIESLDKEPLGAFTWWPVHPVSFNDGNNPLVSSDSKGYAALLFDGKMNPGERPGKGTFVSGFGSSNLGDVNPFVPEQVGAKIDASGDIERTKYLGTRQFEKAYELFNDQGTLQQLKGPIRFAHRFIDTNTINVTVKSSSGEMETLKLCKAALGYSYIGLDPNFQLVWDSIRDLIKEPSAEMIACQFPKLVALPGGEMDKPWEWTPSIISLQLFQIGTFDIVGSPGESGHEVVVAGLANNYINYITTPEEYDTTEYEGGATIYGRNSLPVTLGLFQEMAAALINGEEIPAGPAPPSFLDKLNTEIVPRVDIAYKGRPFGSVIRQPNLTYLIGDEMSVIFASASPRHSSLRGGTFFLIERLEVEGGLSSWKGIRTDADLDTTFWWNSILNEGEIKWTIAPETPTGTYRVRHFGYHLEIMGDLPRAYQGVSDTFQVITNFEMLLKEEV